MKKFLIWTGSIISMGVLLAAGFFWAAGHLSESLNGEPAAAETPKTPAEEERLEQTGYIGGSQLDRNMLESEYEVYNVMHQMTHQKVKADDKWGAIPMTKENIDAVHKALNDSQFTYKKDLLQIIEKWQNNDFSAADEDHNFFWKLQGGNVGKAYGLLSPEEEQEFIKNNFEPDS